jgi:hypothetical protein
VIERERCAVLQFLYTEGKVVVYHLHRERCEILKRIIRYFALFCFFVKWKFRGTYQDK